jgi:hypothetical protein
MILNEDWKKQALANPKGLEQAIYETMLLDDRLQCTCDEIVRERSYFQAAGHYHHCMLYQVVRAIEISLKFVPAKVSENEK